jgi:hypothetical protein
MPGIANFARTLPKTFTGDSMKAALVPYVVRKYLTRLWPEVCLEEIRPGPQSQGLGPRIGGQVKKTQTRTDLRKINHKIPVYCPHIWRSQ